MRSSRIYDDRRNRPRTAEVPYRQGRASIEQLQPPVGEQLTFLPAARPKLAQSEPYSKAVKLDQERAASAIAASLVRMPELLP